MGRTHGGHNRVRKASMKKGIDDLPLPVFKRGLLRTIRDWTSESSTIETAVEAVTLSQKRKDVEHEFGKGWVSFLGYYCTQKPTDPLYGNLHKLMATNLGRVVWSLGTPESEVLAILGKHFRFAECTAKIKLRSYPKYVEAMLVLEKVLGVCAYELPLRHKGFQSFIEHIRLEDISLLEDKCRDIARPEEHPESATLEIHNLISNLLEDILTPDDVKKSLDKPHEMNSRRTGTSDEVSREIGPSREQEDAGPPREQDDIGQPREVENVSWIDFVGNPVNYLQIGDDETLDMLPAEIWNNWA